MHHTKNQAGSGLAILALLTYMATIEDAVKAEVLEVYDLPEWESRLPIRQLWVARDMREAIEGCDEMFDPSKGVGGRSLFEHIEIIFCDFRCAQRIPAGDLKRMMPTKNGVWKMHPPKMRVYGWCPAKHAFAAVTFALEEQTKKDKKLNNRKMQDVLTFIKQNKLSDHVERGEINVVFP